ncbi:MAG: hypothetical protein LQ343_007773 [Gyalolechia ehrenbergii]|nr:MAG: hypothetical protein LQ343_007773 [Gyalolechia ehrenbergii]
MASQSQVPAGQPPISKQQQPPTNSRQHRDPNQPPHTSSNKRRHSPSYRNNGRASQRQKVDKPDAPFYGLFRGVENCIEQLVTLETLSTILDHEWPEEMKVTSVRTVTAAMLRDSIRFERQNKILPGNLQWDPMTPLRVSRAIYTCRFLRNSPNGRTADNSDVFEQLRLWELDYRMYFYLNWPNGDLHGREIPNNESEIRVILQFLETSSTTNSSSTPSGTSIDVHSINTTATTTTTASRTAISAGPTPGESVLDAETNTKIRRFVEASVITDTSSALPLRSYIGNETAKRTLKAYLLPESTFATTGDVKSLGCCGASSVLLFGPNGTGKTSMCLSAAKDSGRTFFQLTNSVLSTGIVGNSEKVLRQTFLSARQHAPSVIFIDEIDKVVKADDRRDSFTDRVEGEMLCLWSQAVREGWDVAIIGATNYMDRIPMAIRSRFTKHVYVGNLSRQNTKTMLLNVLDFRFDFSDQDINELTDKFTPLGPRAIQNFVNDVKRDIKLRLFEAEFFRKTTLDLDGTPTTMWVPCDEKEDNAVRITRDALYEANELVSYKSLSMKDVVQRFGTE